MQKVAVNALWRWHRRKSAYATLWPVASRVRWGSSNDVGVYVLLGFLIARAFAAGGELEQLEAEAEVRKPLVVAVPRGGFGNAVLVEVVVANCIARAVSGEMLRRAEGG